MTVTTETPASRTPAPLLFAVAVFLSASLVFIVQPMIARMILPRLGGSSAVWNTSLAFFQAALLGGYAYAHWLQKVRSLQRQMVIHLAVLAAACVALPLRIPGWIGDPAQAPALWLLGVLAIAVGAPFAALSATAPLIQAWFARIHGQTGRDPYVLYAASNLGSLLALLAYPLVVEPFARLGWQSAGWSVGYVAFAVLLGGLALLSRTQRQISAAAAEATAAPPVPWSRRLVWMLLAAAPSSLLLGVTGHITADIASAPFLWVLPLALYLVTFIIAFQAKPWLPPSAMLVAQTILVPAALLLTTRPEAPPATSIPIHLLAFFVTAQICAFTLADRRPPPSQLTQFYLWMSIGGVLGGAFNAFVAPLIFNAVWEYPLVLVLAVLARPAQSGRMTVFDWGWVTVSLIAAGLVLAPGLTLPRELEIALMFTPAASALLLRGRPLALLTVFAALSLAAYLPSALHKGSQTFRSFFGVVRITESPATAWPRVRMMVHGSTLHGTQGMEPWNRCLATTYYAPATPIGQVFRQEQARRRAMAIGAVGLGTGTVATYVRPSDALRFFEIDKLVVQLAFDPSKFSYVKGCAKGPVTLTLGDARLQLEKLPPASFDLLLIDAFSSDSVPTHLMTVQAMQTYLRALRPGGVVVLHLSNRNLELIGPAAAAMHQAGGDVLEQTFNSTLKDGYVEASSHVIIAAREPSALDVYYDQAQWTPPTRKARAWTDDYINVAGAMWAQFRLRGGF